MILHATCTRTNGITTGGEITIEICTYFAFESNCFITLYRKTNKKMPLQQIESQSRTKAEELLKKHFGNLVKGDVIERLETIGDYGICR